MKNVFKFVDKAANHVAGYNVNRVLNVKNVFKFVGKAAKHVTGVQAYQERKKAKKAKTDADDLLEYLENENERRRSESNKILKDFGMVRLQALKSTVGTFLNYLDILGHKYKEKEYEILNKLDIKPEQVKELKTVEMNASTALLTAGASGGLAAAALAGVPSAVTGVVSAVATASTGTAISSLSGAAAWNATLAWLGGGSLASGGGGMALGTVVLSGITYAATGIFALASAGLISSAYYSKKHTEAIKYLSAVKKNQSELRLAWTLMEGVNQRAQEIKEVTMALQTRIENRLVYLEPLIYDFNNKDEYHLQVFQECAILVKSMSELAQVSIMDKEGNASVESRLIMNKIEKILNKNL